MKLIKNNYRFPSKETMNNTQLRITKTINTIWNIFTIIGIISTIWITTTFYHEYQHYKIAKEYNETITEVCLVGINYQKNYQNQNISIAWIGSIGNGSSLEANMKIDGIENIE